MRTHLSLLHIGDPPLLYGDVRNEVTVEPQYAKIKHGTLTVTWNACGYLYWNEMPLGLLTASKVRGRITTQARHQMTTLQIAVPVPYQLP
jgi:hypothetical protein